MWERWSPSSEVLGADVVLFSLRRADLEPRWHEEAFERLTTIRWVPIVKKGRTVTHLYWRVGYGYRGLPAGLRRGAPAGSAHLTASQDAR